VSLDSDLFTVIGVLEADFDGRALSPSLADGPDIWLPLQMDPGTSSDLNVYFAAARLREGASIELARTETAHAANLVRRTLPGVMPVDNGLSVERGVPDVDRSDTWRTTPHRRRDPKRDPHRERRLTAGESSFDGSRVGRVDGSKSASDVG